jgi:hypothetical protein
MSGDHRPELLAGSGLVSGLREEEDSGEDTDDLIEDARNFVTIGRRWAKIKTKAFHMEKRELFLHSLCTACI